MDNEFFYLTEILIVKRVKTDTCLSCEKKNKTIKKLKAFNIPIDLIDLIKINADKKTGGNQSALLINILEGKMKLE